MSQLLIGVGFHSCFVHTKFSVYATPENMQVDARAAPVNLSEGICPLFIPYHKP